MGDSHKPQQAQNHSRPDAAPKAPLLSAKPSELSMHTTANRLSAGRVCAEQARLATLLCMTDVAPSEAVAMRLISTELGPVRLRLRADETRRYPRRLWLRSGLQVQCSRMVILAIHRWQSCMAAHNLSAVEQQARHFRAGEPSCGFPLPRAKAPASNWSLTRTRRSQRTKL